MRICVSETPAGAVFVFGARGVGHRLTVQLEDRVPFAPPAAKFRVDLQKVPDIMAATSRLKECVQAVPDWIAPVPLAVQPLKRVKPEIGIRAMRTKQVACDVLPLRIYDLPKWLTPFSFSVNFSLTPFLLGF
jgi:hypothetical protein